jgi:serine/threonine protein kinase
MQCAFQKVNEKKKSRERGRNVIMEQRNTYDNFWVAPELLRCTMNVSSTASDVYSYAIVTQEIFSRQEPYDEHADFSTPVDVISAVIKNGLRPEPSTDTPITFRQIMEIAWSDNVLSRPTFDQICKMIQYAHPLRKSVLDSIIDTMEKYT